MLHEVCCELVEPVVSSDNFVVPSEQFLDFDDLFRIEFRLFNGVRDPIVQIEAREAEFFPSVVVYELDGRTIIDRTLEIVARHIRTEYASSELVVPQ